MKTCERIECDKPVPEDFPRRVKNSGKKSKKEMDASRFCGMDCSALWRVENQRKPGPKPKARIVHSAIDLFLSARL